LSIGKGLDQYQNLLEETEAAWHSDKALFEKATRELDAGQFREAEATYGQMSKVDWPDVDSESVKKRFAAELQRLLREIEALLPSQKNEALALAQKYSQMYLGSAFIGDAIHTRYRRLAAELRNEADSKRRRRKIFFVSVIFIGVCVGLFLYSQKVRADLDEKERTAWAQRVSDEPKQLIAAGDRNAKEVSEGIILLDAAGRRLMLISGGPFRMGSSERQNNPERRVNVSAFFIGETEVTYAEWSSVLWWAKGREYVFSNNGKGGGDSHPVTNVSWYDAVKWCNAKSEKEGLSPCYRVDGEVCRK
ncbi:MAG: SUMF1/EgtB/PvdO family nonheme iron enzyme, partial [Verrucomicrobiota bacterium]